jgi:hypothetical protein
MTMRPPLRRAVFGAFVLGLGLPITLSQSALVLLTLLWLWRLREPETRAAARWPLWQPILAFSAVSLVSALASGHPLTALGASKGLLLVAALYVTADVLSGPADGHRVLSALLVVVTVAAALGLLQTVVCPGQAADYGSPAWLYHRCSLARGFFSIYITLAGVLSLVLLASLPQLLPGAALPPLADAALARLARRLAGDLHPRRVDGIRRGRARLGSYDPQGAVAHPPRSHRARARRTGRPPTPAPTLHDHGRSRRSHGEGTGGLHVAQRARDVAPAPDARARPRGVTRECGGCWAWGRWLWIWAAFIVRSLSLPCSSSAAPRPSTWRSRWPADSVQARSSLRI